MGVIIANQVNQVLRVMETELCVQFGWRSPEDGDSLMAVDEDGQVLCCIGKECGAVVVDTVVFPNQGVVFRVPLIGVGVVAYDEPIQCGDHGGF